MTVTRANVEAVTVKRCGSLMSAAGLAVTVAGSNADLNDPIGWAIRQAGGTVASPASVTDADVLTVSDAMLDAFLSLAELRTLENAAGNYALVDITAGPEKESLSQLAGVFAARIAALDKKIQAQYGIGGAQMQTGILTLNFATKDDDPEITA